MRSNVTFRTTVAFDIDRQPIGEAVARALAEHLRERGVAVGAPKNHDDFAWAIDAGRGRSSPCPLVGYLDDSAFEWLGRIIAWGDWLARLRGRDPRAERDAFARAIHLALAESDEFSDVRWHEGDYSDDGWTPHP